MTPEIERYISPSRADFPVIFSVHSIPVEKDTGNSSRPYSEKVRLSSDLVAKRAGLKKWQIAYQSCRKNPEEQAKRSFNAQPAGDGFRRGIVACRLVVK